MDGLLPEARIAKTLYFMIIEIGDGFVAFERKTGLHLLNPLGIVHGDWTPTLIDTVTGCAAHSTLPAGVRHTTIETKANFSRAISAQTVSMR